MKQILKKIFDTIPQTSITSPETTQLKIISLVSRHFKYNKAIIISIDFKRATRLKRSKKFCDMIHSAT